MVDDLLNIGAESLVTTAEGDVKLDKLFNLPIELLLRFFIPMMFICLVVLGAMQGKYGYNSVFLEEVELKMFWLGELFSGAIYGIVELIFNMASARPNLFLFISSAITLYLLYSTIRHAFWGDRWPFNVEDENEEGAQYYVDEADDKFLSKEDLDGFKRGKLRLQKKYLDGYEIKEIQQGGKR